LKRLRLVRYETSFCLGWHVRSPRWFPVFRALSRLDSDDDHYIVFSEWEIGLYQANLGIARERMHFLPYGDWSGSDDPAPSPAQDRGDYYFAGGFSNRDYPALIAAFRAIPARLVIICSALNKELDALDIPPNVTILHDRPSDEFDAYVRDAKACIIPLKHDTGASGQSVMLRLMRHRKAIIATDFGSVRGYVIDGESAAVARIERDPASAEALGAAAHERYCRYFSRDAGGEALGRILARAIAG
jgi:glycosyltransferase involved in cell wall biosynthesis